MPRSSVTSSRAARSLAEGSVTAKLDQALDELDDLVRELRLTTLGRAPPYPHATSTASRASRVRHVDRGALPPGSHQEATGALTAADAEPVRLWRDADA
jgi:hypothetical protein